MEALEIGNAGPLLSLEKAQVIRDEKETLKNDRDVVGSIDRYNSAGSEPTPAGTANARMRGLSLVERETGTVAVYDKSLGPKVGDSVGIAYLKDLGSVKELRERARTRELVR